MREALALYGLVHFIVSVPSNYCFTKCISFAIDMRHESADTIRTKVSFLQCHNLSCGKSPCYLVNKQMSPVEWANQ